MSRARATAALALALFVPLHAQSAEEPLPDEHPVGAEVPITGPEAEEAALRRRAAEVPDDATLVAAGAEFGEITIHVRDVFDVSKPEENHWPFRLVNKLHLRTRGDVVRQLLLFRTGDRYDPELIAESERLLRDTRYLYDAWIRLTRWDGRRADIEVTTRDVWTLSFGLGFGRSGGESTTRIGIEDSNFLGLGKEITLQRTDDPDRTESLYRYRDPNLAGSRAQLELSYSDNSDGRYEEVGLARPFFALDAPWASGALWWDSDREDTLWDAGEEIDRFRHREEWSEGWAGFSRGIVGRRVLRWSAGFVRESDQFDVVAGLPPPDVLPADRTVAYPWLGIEVLPARFVTGRNLNQLVRTEDLRLGLAVTGRLGLSSTAFGASSDDLVWNAKLNRTWTPSAGRAMVVVDAATSGRWGDDGRENAVLGGAVHYYVRNLTRHVFYALLDATVASRLDAENQLLLGGDNGLRGYPLRYESGDRRVLATIEQRLYTNWHLLQLVRVGAAAFLDVGRAWYGDPASAPPGTAAEHPWLADVGVGLRFGSSRSSRGGMLHLDVAWALNAPPGVDTLQVNFGAKEQF